MENLNKIISLFLGIIVFIILFVVIAGRLNIGKNFTNIKGGSTSKNVTPTPTIAAVTIKKTIKSTTPKKTSNNRSVTGVKTIPSTGPSLFIPIALSALAAGAYLNKKN